MALEFLFQAHARVAFDDLDFCRSVSQEGEILRRTETRESNVIGIELVEAEIVSWLSVGCDRTHAKPDRTHAQGLTFHATAVVHQGIANTALPAVVACR